MTELSEEYNIRSKCRNFPLLTSKILNRIPIIIQIARQCH